MATIRIFATRQKELFSGPVTECDYKPQLIIYFHILLQEARERERERERERKIKCFLNIVFLIAHNGINQKRSYN